MSIKIRCRFRKCGQGGGRGWFQKDGRVVWRGRLRPLMVPRYCGRGQWKIWRDARYFRGMQGVGRLWSGDGKRTTDVPRCAVLFRHAGRVISGAGEGGAPSDGLLVRGLGRLEKTRGEGEIFHRRRPEAAPGRARHDAVAPGIGSAMASPSPLVKELSSRSIPGRWPCP